MFSIFIKPTHVVSLSGYHQIKVEGRAGDVQGASRGVGGVSEQGATLINRLSKHKPKQSQAATRRIIYTTYTERTRQPARLERLGSVTLGA